MDSSVCFSSFYNVVESMVWTAFNPFCVSFYDCVLVYNFSNSSWIRCVSLKCIVASGLICLKCTLTKGNNERLCLNDLTYLTIIHTDFHTVGKTLNMKFP